jgi:hypothetical protein
MHKLSTCDGNLTVQTSQDVALLDTMLYVKHCVHNLRTSTGAKSRFLLTETAELPLAKGVGSARVPARVVFCGKKASLPLRLLVSLRREDEFDVDVVGTGSEGADFSSRISSSN